MYCYSLAGLSLQSAWPLDGLEPSSPSLRQSWRIVPRTTSGRPRVMEQVRLRHQPDGSWRLSWGLAGAFWIQPQRRQVQYARVPGASSAAFRDCLIGPVAACLLTLDGRHPLHASAVRIAGEAVAFLGQPGVGKSTMAAACLLAGYPVIADDLLTIRWQGATPCVCPGYPEIRLWPGSGRRLIPRFDRLPRVVPTASKRYLDPRQHGAGFADAPVPLRAIYELRRSKRLTRPRVEPVAPHDAFLLLLPHLYNTAMQAPQMLAEQFHQLGALARGVTIRRLILPRAGFAPTRLPDVVLHDLQR